MGLLPPAAPPAGGRGRRRRRSIEDELYSERFLVRRPLLRAIDRTRAPPPVLLIDEVDRADDEFEAFLLEILSDYSVTVPELGTFRAATPPIVIAHVEPHPRRARRAEASVPLPLDRASRLRARARDRARCRRPRCGEALARQVAGAVEALRGLELYKPPGVAETIDWAQALAALGVAATRRAHGRRRRSAPCSSTARTRSACAAQRIVSAAASACGASRPCADAPSRASTRAGRRLEPRLADRGRVRRACCAAAGSTSRSARRSRSPRRSRRVGLGPTATDVYWAGRATLVRRPEDIADLRPRLRRVLRLGGPRRRRDADDPSRRRSTLAFDDRPTTPRADDGRRPAPTRPDPAVRCSRGRGAAPPRLRGVHARPSSPRPGA